MSWFTKKVRIRDSKSQHVKTINAGDISIRDEQAQELEVVELWEVRWKSRNGMYHSDVKPEIEVFTSQQDAKAFKSALEDAFKLIRHTSGIQVTCEKRSY